MSQTSPDRVRRGFTLVELTVVTLVVMALLLILWPVVCAGRGHAVRRRSCPTNLKLLATAAALYAVDYDEQYPPRGRTCLDPARPDGSEGCPGGALTRVGRRYGYTETWQGGGLVALLPYLKDETALWCASATAEPPLPADPRSYYAGFEWLKSPKRVRFPAQKVLLIEAYANHFEQPRLRFDEPTRIPRRHYIAYVDGHVRLTDLSTGCSGNPHPSCEGWESCLGKGANGNYVCSGYGNGVNVPDFPVRRVLPAEHAE